MKKVHPVIEDILNEAIEIMGRVGNRKKKEQKKEGKVIPNFGINMINPDDIKKKRKNNG